jgi:hypothetical protein
MIARLMRELNIFITRDQTFIAIYIPRVDSSYRLKLYILCLPISSKVFYLGKYNIWITIVM